MGWFDWLKKAPMAEAVYSVMNDDHVELYRLLGELKDGLGQPNKTPREREAQRALLSGTIRVIIEKARAHFDREEMLMAQYGYPESKAHRSEHLMLIRSVETHFAKLVSERRPITEAEVTYLRAWLTNHIRTADRQLDRFLIASVRKSGNGAAVRPGHGDGAWSVNGTVLWATLNDSVSRETVNGNRQTTMETLASTLKKRLKREEGERLAADRRERARSVRQTHAVFYR